MFGFGKVDGLNRVQYNTRVRDLLEGQMQIVTDNDENPFFPGILRFADLIMMGWHNKLNAEEAALGIAIAYLDGASKGDPDAVKEARRVFWPIGEYLRSAAKEQKLRPERGMQLADMVGEVKTRLNI